MDVHYAYHEQHHQYDSFDAVYASHLLGQRKPDRMFWQQILEAENAIAQKKRQPEYTFHDMIFFDDNQENVTAAARLGIKAYLFETAKKAAAALKQDFGIHV